MDNIKEWITSESKKRSEDSDPYHFGDLKKYVKTIGMYAIYYPDLGIYFGSTNHLYRRRIKHIADLKNGVHESRALQAIYDKSPEKKFQFLYLPAEDREAAYDLEQLAIDAYQDDALLLNTGTNARKPSLGVKYGPERLKQMSETTKRQLEIPGRRTQLRETTLKLWQDNREKMVKKCLPNLKKGIEATSRPVIIDNVAYPSVSEAARSLGVTNTVVMYRCDSNNFPTWKRIMPKETKADKIKIEKPKGPIGMMLHCDGSSRPNPGYAGWGLHGYMYEDLEPTKGTGNPDYVLTASDYMSKVTKATLPNVSLVTPLKYYDGWGALENDMSTNNAAELSGAIEALMITAAAVTEDGRRPEKLNLWSDSKYVVLGCEHARKWQANGWLKADQTEPANVELWKKFIEEYDALTALGVTIKLTWNKGHKWEEDAVDNNLGNELVDELAYVGMRAATMGEKGKKIVESAPEGYWKYETDRHPFLTHRRMYYNSLPEYNTPGEYCIGEHDKNDDMAGKRMANGAYAYVRLEQPEAVLETVRNYSHDLVNGDDVVMIARLDYIYNSSIHAMIMEHGDKVLRPRPFDPSNGRPSRAAIIRNPKEHVTREHYPPLLIERAVNELEELRQILDDHLEGKDVILTETDLTPLIYESQTETNRKGEEKVITKLKPEFKVGTATMDVDVNYMHPNGELRTVPIKLLLGLDLLDRNALRRIEDMEPDIRLVSWSEQPQAFRYATIIKVKGGVGIWGGVYSNLRLIPK